MEFVRGLLILATFLLVASADANDNDYMLPPNKEYIKPCQGETLRLHPGLIDEQRMLPFAWRFLGTTRYTGV